MDKRIVHHDTPARKSPKVIDWIVRHSDHNEGDCLIWPFARGKAGYGNCYFRKKYMNAHKVMCIIAHGEQPEHLKHVAHSCGRGLDGCVNPKHLRWATPKENNREKVRHGTQTRGEDHHSSKLTEDQVREIKALKGSASYREIGSRHGISPQHVERIVNGTRWCHI